MKIIFRQINAATAFTDKRIVVTKAAARLIELRPGHACQSDAGKLDFLEPGEELIEMVKHSATNRQEWIEVDVNRLCAANHQRR